MVNTSYINNATGFFDRMVRLSSETGYIFGHGLVALVALVAAYRAYSTGQGTSAVAAYASFWAFVASVGLWGAGWESSVTVVFCLSFLILVVLVIILDRST